MIGNSAAGVSGLGAAVDFLCFLVSLKTSLHLSNLRNTVPSEGGDGLRPKALLSLLMPSNARFDQQ